jgi:hypothetical protein
MLFTEISFVNYLKSKIYFFVALRNLEMAEFTVFFVF